MFAWTSVQAFFATPGVELFDEYRMFACKWGRLFVQKFWKIIRMRVVNYEYD